MNLLAPLALVGLVGLSLPLLAHLLGREQPEKIKFAAVRFLASREPVVTQRRSVRDWPLLALRLLMLTALIVVLARPVAESEAAVAVLAEPHDAVILLDGSASMELRVEGRRDRDRALERLDTILDALPPGGRVGLVISDPRAPGVELTEVSAGADRIRASVDSWMSSARRGPRPGPWTLAEALPRAAALVSDSHDLPRIIYAIGDPTDRGLGSLPELASGAVTVVPVPTRGAPGELAPAPEHVGIRELSWEPAPELDAKTVRIRALVHRYGPHGGEAEQAPELEVGAALEIGDEEVARARVTLGPNQDAPVEFTHTLAELDTADGARARVRLLDREGDPFPLDDRRHLWLTASEALDVLVINGDPSETRANDEIFFLSTALANSELADSLHIRGLTVDQLEDRLRGKARATIEDPLAELDVLVLANVRALPPELAPAIVERVSAGMGLLISVGDRVSASEYNERFGALLPLLLREAVYAGTAPGRTEARSESLAPVQLSHPIFSGLGAEGGGDLDLSATRTRRLFLLEPDPRRSADIAVGFTSGAPALITREHGGGRVALLTTTVDRDWGDLPLRPGFVPLATRTVAWLAGAAEQGASSTIGVGASKRLEPGDYTVTTPSGEVVPISGQGEEGAVFEATDRPGHYRASKSGAGESEPGERFVVELDPREADTTPVEPGRPELEGESGAVTIYEPRWRELAMIVLLLVGIESGLRWWWGRRA